MDKKRSQKYEEENVALNTYIKLMRATNSVTDKIHRHLSTYKLTHSQFAILEVIYHLGPMCQKDIGKKILKSKGNITLVVDNLEKRNLLERKRSKKDRRYYNINLTQIGKELIQNVFPYHRDIVTKEFSILSLNEQKELARLCKKLGMGE